MRTCHVAFDVVCTHKEMCEALCSLSHTGLKPWLMQSDSRPGLSCCALFLSYLVSLILTVTQATWHSGFIQCETKAPRPMKYLLFLSTLLFLELNISVWTYKEWKGHREFVCLFFLKLPKIKKKRPFNVDLSKPLEIHLMMAVHAVGTCGIYYATWLTSGRAFSGFRVHSCPELSVLSQTGPLGWLH